MKTLRYLLMVVAMVSVLGVCAQGLAQEPQVQMTSTSGMVYSGSNLPQAAATGATLAGETPGAYSPGRAGHIRRGASEEDEGDTPPEDPHGPMEDPIGDAAWLLILAAAVYGVYRRKRV